MYARKVHALRIGRFAGGEQAGSQAENKQARREKYAGL
jgi:hypothetical protein